MRKAIAGFDWAFALRWFVHPIVRRPICVDTWESVGPGRGVYNRTFGGYVDPNCLMFDKLNCRHAPLYWTFPLAEDPGSADRNMFHHLNANHRSNGTGQATVYYTMNASDRLHAERQKIMGHAYTRIGEMAPLQH
jgi:hypothetical protein